MAPLLNELFSKIELFYIKIGAINNYFTLNSILEQWIKCIFII